MLTASVVRLMTSSVELYKTTQLIIPEGYLSPSHIYCYILTKNTFPKGVFILCLIQKYDDSILILLKFVKLIKGNFCIVQTKESGMLGLECWRTVSYVAFLL